MKKLIILLCLTVSTPTLAASLAPPKASGLDVLKQFAVTDLQAALDDANSQSPPDAIAATCYSALIPLVQSSQITITTPKGVFSALQKGRDLVNTANQVRSNVGPVADAKNKCAAVILDTQNFLIQLGVLGAGAALKPF